MVECLVWDQDAAGSSPVASTRIPEIINSLGFFVLYSKCKAETHSYFEKSIEFGLP